MMETLYWILELAGVIFFVGLTAAFVMAAFYACAYLLADANRY